jgi:hypothetical protein
MSVVLLEISAESKFFSASLIASSLLSIAYILSANCDAAIETAPVPQPTSQKTLPKARFSFEIVIAIISGLVGLAESILLLPSIC